MPKIHLTLPQLSPQQIQAIWKRVDTTPGQGPQGTCWEWRGFRNLDNYGQFAIGHPQRRTYVASRLVYLIYYGIDLAEMQACHRCDHPPCCNPFHLFKGTGYDNMQDCIAKGRIAKGDRSPSRLHPDRVARGDRHSSRTHPERVARGERHRSRTHPESLVRGEQVNTAKLTIKDILAIRRRYADGEKQIPLAKEFKVLQPTISQIVLRKSWKHI